MAKERDKKKKKTAYDVHEERSRFPASLIEYDVAKQPTRVNNLSNSTDMPRVRLWDVCFQVCCVNGDDV